MDQQEFVKKFAIQFEEADQDKITETTIFRELETWDSMTVMCIQTMILDDFEVVLTNDDLKSLKSVNDVFKFVNAREI